MSIGVNDTGFASVLTQCAAFNLGVGLDIPGLGTITDRPCSTAGLTRYVRNSIILLHSAWDKLEVGLDAHLLAPTVRFVEYPSRSMTNGRDQHDGCGALIGISRDEARWISNRGNELNAAMAEAAERNGWSYVGGIRNAFRGHGYCAGDTWVPQLQRIAEASAEPVRHGASDLGRPPGRRRHRGRQDPRRAAGGAAAGAAQGRVPASLDGRRPPAPHGGARPGDEADPPWLRSRLARDALCPG